MTHSEVAADSIMLAGVKRGTVPVMALACGVMVGNIYVCQPLLAEIARALGVPSRSASFVAVATQVGYALGILFVVPLADIASPAKLVRWLLALTALSLIGAAAAPNIPLLAVASLCLAATTVVPQVLIPIATSLALPQHRGRIVGSLMTGLVMGILLSRTVSGAIAQYAGTWRASFAFAAFMTTLLFFVLPNFMPPRLATAGTVSYSKLLASLPPLLRHRPLLLSMGMNFCVFGAFSALWATLAFHLQSPTFGLGPAAAGLFGLWGAPGALLAPMAGRLSDRWGSARVNGFALCAVLASFVAAGVWGATTIAGLIVAVNLLDFGTQSGQIANQTRIFGIGDAVRARVNTLYMVTTFTGGALGALAGGVLWTAFGWRGVCALGIALVSIAALALAAFTVTARSSAVVAQRA